MEDLAHEILRLAVDGEEHAAEILADQPDDHELHARQHQHRHHQRRPALRRLVRDDRLDDDDDGGQRPQRAEAQAEQRGEPQRHHREIEEHRQPQPDQPAQRVVRSTLDTRQMVDLQASDILRDLEDQPVDIGIRPLVARRDALAHEGGDAAEAREIEARRLVDQPVGAPVGEAAAEVAPGGMLLLGIVGVDRVVVAVARMLEQALHLARRVLQVVVHGDGVGAARPRQARHDRVVLAEIAAEAQHRDRRAGLGGELLADIEAVVRAAIDHQDDLQPALDIEAAQGAHQLADGAGAVVDGNDHGKRRRGDFSHCAPPPRSGSRRTAG